MVSSIRAGEPERDMELRSVPIELSGEGEENARSWKEWLKLRAVRIVRESRGPT